MIKIATGAPNTAVTELIPSSAGAKAVLAMRSQNRQKTAPPKKHPGIMRRGLELRNMLFTKWGTAIPTKDTGPAKAATTADKILEHKIRAARNCKRLTPRLLAYPSPN